MKVGEFQLLLETVKYPKARFLLNKEPYGSYLYYFRIDLDDVPDIFTGLPGPLTSQHSINSEDIEAMDRDAAISYVKLKLEKLVYHEMCEQFVVGDDRPYYPHGSWSERKEEYEFKRRASAMFKYSVDPKMFEPLTFKKLKAVVEAAKGQEI